MKSGYSLNYYFILQTDSSGGKNHTEDYPMKPMVTNITNVLPMVTDVYPMVTDVDPMLAEESSVANPQKVAKIDENI